MFGGVTEALGRVVAVEKKAKGLRLSVDVPVKIAKNIAYGGSLAVSGVCLSVISKRGKQLAFDVVSETLKRTTLGALQPGDAVNLERPLRFGKRIEGHYVQGHVDTTGKIQQVRRVVNQADFKIQLPKCLTKYVFEKGSIAVDGVSLTVGRVEKSSFWIHCIPVTLQKTTFGVRQAGERVNLEADWMVKSLRGSGRKRLNRLK